MGWTLQVACPSFEYLGIFHMDDLKIIWWNQFAVDSFYKLLQYNNEHLLIWYANCYRNACCNSHSVEDIVFELASQYEACME
jgi:hypothetical protein